MLKLINCQQIFYLISTLHFKLKNEKQKTIKLTAKQNEVNFFLY